MSEGGDNNGGPPRNSASEHLDDAFPLGDGTAQLEADVVCPHCAETVSLLLDPGSGGRQVYVEDCHVCCRPLQVSVRYASDGSARVDVLPEE